MPQLNRAKRYHPLHHVAVPCAHETALAMRASNEYRENMLTMTIYMDRTHVLERMAGGKLCDSPAHF